MPLAVTRSERLALDDFPHFEYATPIQAPLSSANLCSMNTPITPAELANLHAGLPAAISASMLDGYLAAAASGPNFVMPDQVLRWARNVGQPADRRTATLIIRHYHAVNDALNDQMYVPVLADPQAWCRGYLAGFAADMTAWAPLTAAQPECLKVVMAGDGAEDLAAAARQIHTFWLERRRTGADGGAVQAPLAAIRLGQTAQPNARLH